MPKISLPANQSEIHNGVEFIEQTIRKYRFKNKEVMKTLLIAEESMVRLIGKTESDVQMQISIRYRYGVAEITISAAGEPLAADEPQIDLTVCDMGHDSEETIRSILLQAFSDKIAGLPQCLHVLMVHLALYATAEYRTKSGVSREPALLQTSTDELTDSSSVLVRSWSLKKVPKMFYW